MEYQTGWWPATPPRHGQRVLDQAGLHVRLQAPAHHLAAKQVDDGGQVQPAFVGLDVNEVCLKVFSSIRVVWNGWVVWYINADARELNI